MATRAVQEGQPSAAPTILGERVRTARRELGMSQAQLAGQELTKGFISQLESGLVRPSIRSLQVLANRLGKPLDYFLGDEPLAAGKRVAFHRLAAEAAAEREEWSEVRGQVGLALEQSPEPRERAQLLRFLAQADVADKDPEAAFERISEALGVIETANEPAEAAQLLYTRGAAYSLMGQLVAATEAFEACRDIIERFEIVEPRLRAKLMVALGTMYRRLNRTTKALSAYESALAIASRSSEIAMAARGYMGIAVSMYDSGELDGAISNYRRALELFRKVSDTEFELNVLQSLAAVHFEQGEIDTARVAAERAMKRAIEVGSSHWAAVAEVVLARVAIAEQRVDDALRMTKHAETILAGSGDELQRADALRVMGAAYETSGQAANADKSYRTSLETYTAIGDHADRSAAAAEYAKVLRARGEIDAAFDMLELARGSTGRR